MIESTANVGDRIAAYIDNFAEVWIVRVKTPHFSTFLELSFRRVDIPGNRMRLLMVYPDTDAGMQAARGLADCLMGGRT